MYGPTGCGKSEGVRSYLKSIGVYCIEVDISEFHHAEELDNFLRDSVCKSQLGQRAILVDGMEGIFEFPKFAEVLVKRMKIIKSLSQGIVQVPFILTCDDLYAFKNRPLSLRALVEGKEAVGIRMFPPFKSSCVSYFNQFYHKSWINLATSEVNNDLRQIHKFLTACSEREAFLKERGEFFQHRKRVAFPHEQCRPIYTNFPLSL